ncbi:unnamed protein product [Meganyctiphanes norvegica]|uniref:Uncharacterized protein n=1 Tax=Meganyctiphanes norvegica TaxID=48144 RepID=A0AAV2RZI8_MEGNR
MKNFTSLVLCWIAVVGIVGGAAQDNQQQARDARVFAYYSTTSFTRLSTTTITAISTCLSVTTAGACTGRKKRRSISDFDAFDINNLETNIVDSSLEVETTLEDDMLEGSHRAARDVGGDSVGREGRVITIWTTGFSTLTITSTSYIPGTTVTASALCIQSGVTAGCFGR